MSALYYLIKSDMKQIYRDPMLLISLVGPFLLILFVRFMVPFAVVGYDLSAYNELLASFFILLIPLIVGIMAGFMMLDERDESMIDFFAVTPLRKQGYLCYRLLLPGVLTVLYGVLYLEWASPVSLSVSATSLVIPMIAMGAPIISLCLVAMAANKIEGLALSKGVGLLVFIPIVIYFVPGPLHFVGGILPTFWAAKLFFVEASNLSVVLLIGCLGVLINVLCILFLTKRFLRKTD